MVIGGSIVTMNSYNHSLTPSPIAYQISVHPLPTVTTIPQPVPLPTVPGEPLIVGFLIAVFALAAAIGVGIWMISFITRHKR